jgi:hypothetical protein
MARNAKAAALLGAIRGERPDYHVPAAPKRLLEPLNIGVLLFFACKEAEGGAVVPNIVVFGRLPFRCVCRNPFHLAAFVAKACACRCKGGFPEEPPISRPSFWARSKTIGRASSSGT